MTSMVIGDFGAAGHPVQHLVEMEQKPGLGSVTILLLVVMANTVLVLIQDPGNARSKNVRKRHECR